MNRPEEGRHTMSFDQVLSATNISSSGLAAERLRMEVIANNIANAHSTRMPGGGVFRRHDVVFSAALKDRFATGVPGSQMLGGVQVHEVVEDQSALPRVYEPGHPDAEEDGFVHMPNVFLPVEMVNLVTASRAYEANLMVLQSFRQMSDQSLALIRG
jgi:flagellar basal-body rod protein FlgC